MEYTYYDQKLTGIKYAYGATTERGQICITYWEEIIYGEGDETLEQIDWKTFGCPILGSVQGQVGWGSEQPGPLGDVPDHGKGAEQDGL